MKFYVLFGGLLVVVLLIGFSVTDGFDIGVIAISLPVVGKLLVERQIL